MGRLGVSIFCCCLAALLACACAASPRLPRGRTHATSTRLIVRKVATSQSPASSIVRAPQRIRSSLALNARIRGPGKLRTRTFAEDVPAGTPIDGEYIIIYKPNVQDVAAATADVQSRALSVAVAAMNAGELATAASADVASMVTVLSTSLAPEGVPSQALIEVPSELDVEAVRESIMQSSDVEAVVANRIVSIAQAEGSCYAPSLAAGVKAVPAPGLTFKWENCLTSAATELGMFGERCGDFDKFKWNGLFAYNKTSGQMIKNCIYLRSSEKNADRIDQFFGTCGVAPKNFLGVPTTVCLEKADSLCADAERVANYAVKVSAALCTAPQSSQVTFQGEACGPNNSLIRWNVMAPSGCSTYARTSLDAKQQADWVGQCGVPPFLITGLPTRICNRLPGSGSTPPPPSGGGGDKGGGGGQPFEPNNPGGGLPEEALAAGESTQNWGMARIGALSGSRAVVDADAAVARSGLRVVVIDTGIDSSHPDLNVVDFVDLVDAPGSANYGQDGHGHGSHVGGIIGARNQGQGVFGVVPNMPLVAIKVFGSSGSGPLDTVYRAYAEVVSRLQKGEKIAAINLSLGAPIGDQTSQDVECGWINRIIAYGTAVVTAAGNDNGKYLGYNMPSACPNAIAVTSLTSNDAPSSFSNLAYSSSPEPLKAKTIAAPGSNIYSTYPGGRFATLSGTSMATPHVAGAFAMCALAGECKFSSAGDVSAAAVNYPRMMAAANSAPCGGSRCGPSWGSANYYGPMVNVRQW